MTLSASELADVRVGKLMLESLTRGQHGLSTNVAAALQAGKVVESTMQATNMTLTVLDRDMAMLNSGLFAKRVEAVIDGHPYRLVQPSLTDVDLVELTFEHALIADMREHKGLKHAYRDTTTRAEFILSMLRELRRPYTLISHELHKHQAVEPAKAETAAPEPTASMAEADRGPGLSPGSLKVKGAAATQGQLDEASTLLSVGATHNAPDVSMIAVVCAGIQESNLAEEPDTFSPNSAGYYGVLQGSAKTWPDPHDTAGMAESFFVGGKGFQGGGAILLARSGANAGTIAWLVEAPGDTPVPYIQWEAEAKAIYEAWKSSGSFTGAGSTSQPSATVSTARYEYTRGQAGQPEDTYTCALRLATEVLWRFFVCGVRSIYFASDDELLRAKPRYLITPQSPGKLTFDVEQGGRTVIMKGRRIPKPSTAVFTARLDRWAAPPGTVIEVSGYGPADDKWLVDQTERPLLDASGTVNLRAPQKQNREPAASASASGGPGGSGFGSLSGSSGPQSSRLARDHPELQAGIRDIAAIVLTQFPTLAITSTKRSGGGTSYHDSGRAIDLAGANMDSIASWIDRELADKLTEGIHNPTLSVKDGKRVDPSFWGPATWAEHLNHIHLAV